MLANKLVRASVLKTLALIFLGNQVLHPYQNKYQYYIYLIQKADELRLWEDPFWHKLLYYNKSVFKGYKSQNISKDFFLSNYGRYSPKSELLRHIDGFLYEGDENNSPECRFPLRYKWIREKLNVDEKILPKRICSDFEEWKNILSPSYVSIVFASGYLSNPSTLYGHTFLILRNKDNLNTPILDYTVNYAATTDDDKGILYAFKGITGLYPGKFSTLPYYIKIQEYQNVESRDLWEYPLKLKEDEIENLIMHLWELGKAEFPYYFFSKNCSWQLIPLFDVAKNTNFSEIFSLWNIPTDTLKLIVREFGDQNEYIYRPSLYIKLKNKIENLSQEEKEFALKLLSDFGNYERYSYKFDNKSKYKIFDTVLDYLTYKHYSGEISQDEMDKKMHPFLLELNKISDVKIDYSDKIKSFSPIQSRNSILLSFGLENNNDYLSYVFKFRPALADLMDFNEGYTKNSALEMGALDFRYIKELNKLYIKDFTAVNVVSLVPVNSWFKKSSWGIKFGYSAYERSKKENLNGKFYIETLRGYSFEIYEGFIAYLMGHFSFNYLNEGKNRFKPSVGPLFGFLLEDNRFKFNLDFKLSAFKNDRGFSLFDCGFSLRTTKNSSVKINYSKTNMDDIFLISFDLFISPI